MNHKIEDYAIAENGSIMTKTSEGDVVEQMQIIATELKDLSYLDIVCSLVPKQYRQDIVLNNRKRIMYEVSLGKFFIYVNFKGQLDWATNIEPSWSDCYSNYQFIDNQAFLFLLRLIFGNVITKL